MIYRWLRLLWIRFFKRPDYIWQVVPELPTRLKNGYIYLETHLEKPWQAAFVCPCGCGEVIFLNLIQDYSPRWRVTAGKRITLSPSVSRKVGCKSHFFITDGDIHWCRKF